MALSIQNAVAAIALLLILAMEKSQSYDFEYDFRGTKPETSILQGDAHFPKTSEYLRLTETDGAGTPGKHSAGRILHSVPVEFWQQGGQVDLQTTIKFSVKGKANDDNPADGIVFFIAPVGTTIPCGGKGGNFGIFDTSGNASSSVFAVEFDIYPNSEWDPSFPHIGIDIESRESVCVTEISDSLVGDEVTLQINYEEATRVIKAVVTTISQRYEVSYVYDLSTILPQQVQVGIAASTGEFVAIHDVISWYFTATMVHRGNDKGNIRQVA